MLRWQIDDAPTALQLNEIARALREGKIVFLPTDTIYGLHGVASNARAVDRIAELKGRDETKPFIVLASSLDDLPQLGIRANPKVLKALDEIWPAPLTVVLPLRQPLPASRGATTLAVRIPALAWLRELIARTGPLVSTSANRSGEPPVENPALLARGLHQTIDAIVDAGTRTGEASAVLDLSSDEPRFIREGKDSFTQKVWKTLWNSL